MSQPAIHAITMPKWGMAMDQGTITSWHRQVGSAVAAGEEVVDAESTKAAAGIESAASGILRRIVARPGDTVPVGGLIGVIASPDVPEEEIEQFVAEFARPEAARGSAAGPEPERLAVGGRCLNVLRTGEGPSPVLFIHGFGGDLSSWQFNQPVLAESACGTIAFDLPGHGLSDPDVGSGSLGDLVQAARHLIHELALDRPHLVGHSLGGAIAAALAVANPARFASVSLIASAGLGPEIDGGYISGFLAARRRNDLRPVVARLFADERLVTRAILEDQIRMKRIDGIEQALARIADSCFPLGRQAGWGLRAALASLPIPLQVIWGAQDRIIPAQHATGFARATLIEGAGHMVHVEKAATVNDLLRRFIAGEP
jgi:pyruvate dehydrogenase E2 component (dihydrolipoamide acetyltransferase)